MLNLGPDKNWRIYLFASSMVLVFVFALWPYILGFIVLYAIAQGFSSQRHHNNRRRRCERRCRKLRRW
jgi:hypothetical protein